MGLKRKGSRLVRVGSQNYRWTISRSAQAEIGHISVIIELAERPGHRISVRTVCRDFWLTSVTCGIIHLLLQLAPIVQSL